MCAIQFFYIFPDGRFVPRWSRLLFGLSVVWGLAWVFLPGSVFDLTNPYRLSVPSFVLLMAWWASGSWAQVYRFANLAGPVQRQQTKWILSATATAIVAYLLFGVDRFALPAVREARLAGVVYDLVGVPLFLIVILVVPIAFAISILRYRLWDIDVIIGRAFVYSFLMAIVAGTYIAAITFLQRLFVGLTGEKSDAAIVVTTLIAAALITPIKGHLEDVARRCINGPGDSTSTLQAFAHQVRTLVEVLDVQQLTANALDATVHAFGASSGAVYLRKGGQLELVHYRGDWTQAEGLSARLQSSAGGLEYGWMLLGPPAGGREYTTDDADFFEQVVGLVSHAIELIDGLGVYASSVRSPPVTALSRETR